MMPYQGFERFVTRLSTQPQQARPIAALQNSVRHEVAIASAIEPRKTTVPKKRPQSLRQLAGQPDEVVGFLGHHEFVRLRNVQSLFFTRLFTLTREIIMDRRQFLKASASNVTLSSVATFTVTAQADEPKSAALIQTLVP